MILNSAQDLVFTTYIGEIPDWFNELSKFCHPILNSYDYKLPNLIYSGHGISYDLHLGHLHIIDAIKKSRQILHAYLYFMFSDDEKYLKDVKIDKLVSQRIINFHRRQLGQDKAVYKLNSNGLNSIQYYHLLTLLKIIKPHTVRKILGESKNLCNYFYPCIQILPILLHYKSYNIFVVTGRQQIPYFNLAKTFLNKNNIKFNFIFIDSVQNTAMTDKMSSRSPKYTIYLNDTYSSVTNKIKKAKSFGKITENSPDASNDFCYHLCMRLNILAVQRDQYRRGILSSEQFKQIVAKFANVYIKTIDYR